MAQKQKLVSPEINLEELTQLTHILGFQTAEEQLKKAHTERSTAELQKAHWEAIGRELQRPWRSLNATVTHDDDRNRWKTEFQGVVAWGETPEMACDNFDHLWMFGAQSSS